MCFYKYKWLQIKFPYYRRCPPLTLIEKKAKCFKGEIHSCLVNLNILMTITSTADFLNKRLCCLPVPFRFPIPILHKDVRVSFSRNGFEIQQGMQNCNAKCKEMDACQNAWLRRILYMYSKQCPDTSRPKSLLNTWVSGDLYFSTR